MPIYVLPASGRGFAFAKQGDYCLPPAGVLHSQNKVIKCAVGAIMNGWRYGIRWLSRFKLIRLRRISLATLRRDGRRDCKRYVQ